MSTRPFSRTRRNRLVRHPERGQYDRLEVYRILDEALFCHVGFVHDDQPFVIPTLHARDGDQLLLHGSSASRMIKHMGGGHPICVTVTLVDGLVLARSAFNHSINYRSATIFGHGQAITAPEAKQRALAKFTERLVPGRWADVRSPTAQELKATGVITVSLDVASAKIRGGPPKDDAEDLTLPVWAGVLPVHQVVGEPLPDADLSPDRPLPLYLEAYIAARRNGS